LRVSGSLSVILATPAPSSSYRTFSVATNAS
jgi:hypothetical protein